MPYCESHALASMEAGLTGKEAALFSLFTGAALPDLPHRDLYFGTDVAFGFDGRGSGPQQHRKFCVEPKHRIRSVQDTDIGTSHDQCRR